MNSNKWRSLVAAAAALAYAYAAGAAPILPAFVRGGHGGHVGHVGGPRGGYHGGRPGGYRGGHNTVIVGGRGSWGRGYRWPPGGAIAAGAAIGVIAAAGAAVYATSRPPAPGLCWYDTDPSRRSGFWDICP